MFIFLAEKIIYLIFFSDKIFSIRIFLKTIIILSTYPKLSLRVTKNIVITYILHYIQDDKIIFKIKKCGDKKSPHLIIVEYYSVFINILPLDKPSAFMKEIIYVPEAKSATSITMLISLISVE